MNYSADYSPAMSSPLTPWSDAHSTFNNSPYLDSSRNGSSTSLWTASSVSDGGEEDDMSSELKCLELLAELEREKRRKSSEEKREQYSMQTRENGYQHSRDDSLPDVVQPLNLEKAKAARNARSTPSKAANSPVPSTSRSTQKTKRQSRRISFTSTDLSELDIDAILDAYTSEALAVPQTYPDFSSYTQQAQIPRSKSSFNLKGDVQSPVSQSSRSSAMYRDSSAQSIRSTRSTRSNGSPLPSNDDQFPQRRTAPFPTITRQRSNASLASRKLPFDTDSLPPLPSGPPPALPTSVPMSNRTFSSFSRQSTASSASASSAHSLPLRSLPGSRMSYASSTMSRQTSASSASAGNSFRWSVATSSTVPTILSDGSSDCGASRRGSLANSFGGGSIKQSPPTRSRRRPSAPFPGSPIEQDEDDRFWGQSPTKPARANEMDDEEGDLKNGGLISWEDFADELASLPVPTRPTPRRMDSQGSSTSSRSRKTSTTSSLKSSTSPFPSRSSNNLVFASPESLRSTSTLTSHNSSSKPSSPFPSTPSPTNGKSSGKKGLLQGLRGMRSTRDLASSYNS